MCGAGWGRRGGIGGFGGVYLKGVRLRRATFMDDIGLPRETWEISGTPNSA